jgi:hypothetical protein
VFRFRVPRIAKFDLKMGLHQAVFALLDPHMATFPFRKLFKTGLVIRSTRLLGSIRRRKLAWAYPRFYGAPKFRAL